MNDWIVKEKWPDRNTGERYAQIICGDWASGVMDYHTAVQVASTRNTDVMGTQLQAGVANARGTSEYHAEGERLLAQQLTDLQESYSKLNDEVIELRGWKRAALQVESQWDEQTVGRALGFTLGCNIRPRILPAILELKQNLAVCVAMLQGVILVTNKAGFPDTASAIEGLLKRRKLI